MNNDRNALKAGIFIVISMALIVALVIGIKGVGRFLEPVQHATVAFKLSDDIGGLAPGDEVRIGGAKVGVVRSVEFSDPSAGDQRIVVGFSMPKRFNVKKDAAITIQSTVTGVSVLNFTSLGSGAQLAEGDMLAGKPSSLSALFDAAPDIGALVKDIRVVTMPKINTAVDKASVGIDRTVDTIASYKDTASSATDLIKYLRSRIDGIIEKYNGVADAARNAMTQIADLFGDTKTDFRTTVANLRDATGTVKESLPGVMQRVDGLLAKITGAVESATVALDDVKTIAANTKDATASARSILVANRSKIDSMISSLKVTGDNLKAATAEVRRSPWRLLYKPGPGEMANLNLYDAARQFAEGANDMNDAASALRDALKDPDAKQTDIDKLVEKLDTSFGNFSEIEKQLWQQVKQ